MRTEYILRRYADVHPWPPVLPLVVLEATCPTCGRSAGPGDVLKLYEYKSGVICEECLESSFVQVLSHIIEEDD